MAVEPFAISGARSSEQTSYAVYHGVMKTESSDLPILYTKNRCPWCEEVITFLDEHGVGYRLKEVTSDPAAFSEMQRKSGQTRAPTMDWHGKNLADFGTDDLVPFLRAQNVKLEDS
jgi:glutaredoxin 3